MTRWFIGTNNYYYEGSIILEEGPWYVFFIEQIMNLICHYVPMIPLPKIKIIRDNEETNLNEYYGTINDLFHLYVHDKIFKWCYNRIKMTFVRFPYQMLDEMFPGKVVDDNDFDDEEMKEEVKKNKEISDQVYKEFKVVYEKLKICKF